MENQKFDEKGKNDDIWLRLGKRIQNGTAHPYMINPQIIRRLLHVYTVMKAVTRDFDVVVTYSIGQPFLSMGCVRIVSKAVLLFDPVDFRQAVSLASNFDVYRRTDNMIVLDFTFHKVMLPLNNKYKKEDDRND